MATNTDRIEKKILLRAPLERVWRAISDSKQFGSWHGVRIRRALHRRRRRWSEELFRPPSLSMQRSPGVRKQYEGTPFSISVERIEPMRFFSMRWYPFDEESGVDYSKEPMDAR